MDCQHITELLPWYLNGTLAATEQESLRAHLLHCAECRKEAEQTRFVLTAVGQHLPEDALVDFIFQRPLPADELEIIERHLADCTECAAEASLLRESLELHNEPARVLPFHAPAKKSSQSVRIRRYAAIAAGLFGLLALGGLFLSLQQNRALQSQLAQQQQQQMTRLAELEAENQKLRQRPAAPDSSPLIAQLEARVRELSAPQANVPVLEIFPNELVQRDQSSSSAAAVKLRIPANARRITLLLNSQSSVEARQYNLEILNSRRRLVTEVQGLIRQKTGDYTLSLSAELLPPGKYTFNISALVKGRLVKIESYAVEVESK